MDRRGDEPTPTIVTVTVKTNDKVEPISDTDIDPTDANDRITVTGNKGEINGRGGADQILGDGNRNRLEGAGNDDIDEDGTGVAANFKLAVYPFVQRYSGERRLVPN